MPDIAVPIFIPPLETGPDILTEMAQGGRRLRLLELGGFASYTGPVDFTAEPDGFATFRDLHIDPVTNATNGVRGDSILSDAANLGGAGEATFVAPDFITVVGADRGSYHGYTAVVTLNEIPGEPGVYAEAGALLGQVHLNRLGAYGAAAELGLVVGEGFPARANGLSIGVIENNAYAEYATSGMSAIWGDTGARGMWLWNLAADPAYEKPGTGIFVQGDWERAGLYFMPVDAAGIMLRIAQAGADNPFLTLNGLGTFVWSVPDGSSQVTLAHSGVNDALVLTGDLGVSGDLTGGTLGIVGAAGIGGALTVSGATVLNSTLAIGDITVFGGLPIFAAVATGAFQLTGAVFQPGIGAAGAGAALPATPEGYFRFYDAAGVVRAVPYYNT